MAIIASALTLTRSDMAALSITDAYSIHRVVYSLFEDVRTDEEKADGKSSGILYADMGGDHQNRRILLLSDRAPAPTVDGKYGVVNSKEVGDDFLGYQTYNFNVIVNPTRQENQSRKIIPVRRHLIGNWFDERAQKWGFRVDPESFQVSTLEIVKFQSKRKNPITLARAHVQGRLHITNHEDFRRSFTRGIGRGKAFGCGLLQIVPVIENPFS